MEKYIGFSLHPKNFDGINAPSNEELIKLEFSDVNIALANIVEALENAPSKGYIKDNLEKMVEKVVSEGTKEI